MTAPIGGARKSLKAGAARDILRGVQQSLIDRRRQQNLVARRVPVSAVTPSIRSFAQAIDRQRKSVERIPALRAARPGLVELCGALDDAEVAALAIGLDDPAAELGLLQAAARAISVPLLRTDLLLEEFQLYESRAAGADAVLLHASLLDGDRLARLCTAARSTHMAPCVACADAGELARALALRAEVVALFAGADGLVPEALLAALPRRVMALVLPAHLGEPDAATPEPVHLRGRADALLDPTLGESATPAADFRHLLEE